MVVDVVMVELSVFVVEFKSDNFMEGLSNVVDLAELKGWEFRELLLLILLLLLMLLLALVIRSMETCRNPAILMGGK